MKANTPISTIMTKTIIGLTREDDLKRAEMLFNRHRIKHIPVVEGESIIGMISYTDLMRISIPKAIADNNYSLDSVVPNNFTIEQVMEKNVVTVTPETSIKDVALILASKGFHSLPVEKDGVLLGIITTRDLLNYFIKEC
ncbi:MULTISPECIES: HPP family protein [unclassified Algibacter]|uniref:CBS domain-containing protein n=1 Tax=unclassified Algibacter TaxID=2615009 RepID=UPI00131ACDCC|nr:MULTISPECIES: CBS domain-containing protein [unclassified Algibacter]MCL5130056.1 CBS domain-containing protein [Algibacter sp. L4_22]